MKKYLSFGLSLLIFGSLLVAQNVFALDTTVLFTTGNGHYGSWTGGESDVDETSSPSCSSSDSIIENSTGSRESFTLDISSVPNDATITAISVSVWDRGDSTSGGTYKTFVRLNGSNTDAVSELSATGGSSDPCSSMKTQSIDVVDVIKSGTTTLEVGVLKTGTNTHTVRVGAVRTVVTYSTDATPPTGGSVSYTDGYYNTASVPVTYTLGTDSESGMNNASGKIQRASATLALDYTCGAFGSSSDLATEFGGSYTDTSVVSGNCYQYQYLISDNAGNTATYTSTNVAKVDTIAPVITINSSTSVSIEYGSTYGEFGATALDSVSSVTSDVTAFRPLHQANRGWTAMAVAPNGNVYAVVLGGGVYMQTGGAGDFASLNQASRNWMSMAIAPNGNVYASVFDGDGQGIYLQTGGIGDFTQINTIDRVSGITVAPNGDVYAARVYGQIYMQTGGAGDFVALDSVSKRNWTYITAAPNGNVYATAHHTRSKKVYMQTGGAGDFVALDGVTERNWTSIVADSNGDVYATGYDSNYPYDSDVYKRTDGTGDFVALNQRRGLWSSLAASSVSTAVNKSVYASFGNESPYENSYTDIYKQTTEAVPFSVSVPVTTSGSVNTSVAGDYNIYYDAVDTAGNHAVQQTRTVHVFKRAVTITADGKAKNFGDADPALTYLVTSGSLASGDSFSGALSRDAGEDVGTYAITQGDLSLNSNYDLTYVGANLVIGQNTITVTVDPQTKVYGTTDPALTYQFSPALEEGDSFSGSLTRSLGQNVGTYAITQGTLALGSNYALSFTGNNLVITPIAITVTADAKSKTYGTADPALTYQITGGTLVGEDSLSGSLSRTAGENVGSYAINQGTLSNSNYTIGYAGANLTINKASQTITFGELGNKTVGDPNFTVSGTASSELPVTFTVGEGSACTISENTVHLTGAGTCTIIAHQGGDNNYDAASDVSRTFTISGIASAPARHGTGSYINTVPLPPTPPAPTGEVLGASTGPTKSEIPGCGMRTTGFSIVSGISCENNIPHNEGQVLGVEKFIFTQWMRMGLKRTEVPELQKRLTAEGFYTGAIDGKFGKLTDLAVRAYQKANPPLRIDGIVGPLTRAVLNK